MKKIQIIALKSYMWIWKSDWGWCLGGAYFLAKFQAGGAYRGGAYKKKRVPVKAVQMKSARSVMKLPAGPISFFCNRPAEMIISPAWFYKSFITQLVV